MNRGGGLDLNPNRNRNRRHRIKIALKITIKSGEFRFMGIMQFEKEQVASHEPGKFPSPCIPLPSYAAPWKFKGFDADPGEPHQHIEDR